MERSPRGSPSLESPPIMNPSYRQTFSRHTVLFSLPVVITTLLAIWFVAGTPKQYRAGATLLTDNASGPSYLNESNPSVTSPAMRAQQLLTGLLASKEFQGEVGRRGPLDAYLAKHPSEGWAPTGLLRRLRGGGSVADRRQKALDAKHVFMSQPSGTLLGIELNGPAPEVAVGTLKALISSFNQQRHALDVSYQQQLMADFSSRISSAKSEVANLNAQIASGSHSAPEIQGLVQVRNTAQSQLKAATRNYGRAALSLDVAKRKGDTYTVKDAPNLPAPPVSGMKKSVMMVFAGMFVGFLISLLAVVLLTSGETKAEEDELRDVVAQAHNDPVPLDRDAAKSSNGNGAGAQESAPKKAERAG